jgi:hypothetical protein
MTYFTNPDIVFQQAVHTPSGRELHAWTVAPLDCLDPHFNQHRRNAVELEALALATSSFDRVELHQL